MSMMSLAARWRFAGRRPEREQARDFVLSRMPRGGVCAEIGVDEGKLSKRIFSIAEPALCYLIDPWFPDSSGRRDRRAARAAALETLAVELRSGRAILLETTSEDAASKIAAGALDWLYVDGNHRYEFVSRDLELYWPKVKRGGYVVCDDYHFAGDWDDGVTRAVDEFMRRGFARKLYKRRSQFVMKKLREAP
ncbi:MAG TPA: class I SAM-dependent methyltransferase [Candidatus Binataceae bacterium]|nr:class I SAM-dependent methyltransferase [Candidatus Binataceae bacterium]